jgi:hypothetical protein
VEAMVVIAAVCADASNKSIEFGPTERIPDERRKRSLDQACQSLRIEEDSLMRRNVNQCF